MRTETVNGVFSFPVPDDFETMTEEQLRKYYSTTENLVGFYRKEDNSMINVGFTPKKLLLSMMFSAEDILKTYDAGFSKRLNNYTRTGRITAVIAGMTCPGMSFEYNTQLENVPMKAEVWSIKHKGAFYAVIFIVRRTDGQDLEKLSAGVLPYIRFEE